MRLHLTLFIAGILTTLGLPALPPPVLVCVIAMAAAIALAFKPMRGLGLFGLAAVWSVAHMTAGINAAIPAGAEGEIGYVDGIVDSFPLQRERSIGFQLAVRRLDIGASSVPTPGRIQLAWFDPEAAPQLGSRCEFYVRLKRPHGVVNPGGFDKERHLLAQRIAAVGYVVAHPRNSCRPKRAPLAVATWRVAIAKAVESAPIATPTAAVLKGLTVGDRSGLSAAQWDVFRRTGTAHLLAISGLHVGLAAAWTFWLLRPVCGLVTARRQELTAFRPALLAALVAAFVYAALAGFALPTRRALLALAVATLAAASVRRVASSDVLLWAMAAVLALDPLAALAGGFWLSFGAVAVLIWTSAGRVKRGAVLATAARAHLLLALGLAPVLLVVFGEVPVVSPLANLIAVPWCALLVVPLALAGVLLATFDAELAHLCWDVAARSWLPLWWLLSALAENDWLAPLAPSIDSKTALCIGLALAILSLPRGLPGRRLGVVLLCAPLLPPQPALRPGEFRVLMLDVGQGLAVYVETAHHRLLYDAGPLLGTTSDAGSRIVAPALRAVGVGALDTLVISHADADHAGGAAAVLQRFPVAELIVSPPTQELALRGAHSCARYPAWSWDGVSFTFLHPQAGFTGSRNDRSCVLLIAASGGRALLAGDIEARAEAALLRTHGSVLQADILVVPHHGSESSSTHAFIDAVRPAYAWVSAGYRNRYALPHAAVIARYAASGAEVQGTAALGALQAIVGATDLRVSARRRTHARFWRQAP